MNLTEAILSMRAEPTPENSKAFADFFRGLVNENAQVYTAATRSGTGYAIDTAEHVGNIFCIMFSDSSKLEKKEGSYACTIGLSNLIDSVYANPHIAGLVINPNDNPVFFQRKDLQIVSGKPDPRQAKRDWGKGIPEYTAGDVMVAEEAQDFAMEIVAMKGLEPDGYELLETNSGLTAFPNFIAKKDGQLYFISVDVTVAPKVPHINENVVPDMMKIAKENNARVLYAPVSIASSDPERMANSLVLIGDDYIGNFLGFVEVF